jgi:hypothetical protein
MTPSHGSFGSAELKGVSLHISAADLANHLAAGGFVLPHHTSWLYFKRPLLGAKKNSVDLSPDNLQKQIRSRPSTLRSICAPAIWKPLSACALKFSLKRSARQRSGLIPS